MKPCDHCGKPSDYFGIAANTEGVYELVIYLCKACLDGVPLGDDDQDNLLPGAETSRSESAVERYAGRRAKD